MPGPISRAWLLETYCRNSTAFAVKKMELGKWGRVFAAMYVYIVEMGFFLCC
ncbi:hypothetical protein R3W88_030514 [Solanum pinnatisectum]|uniref:Uncharacterized protein n=1 Tax=Solanum pinnatisectum TaxID=50273 RepID=A0AAV9K8E3_9SOLN|nr:hypothetical protein R3W88_030514 [Solanum pinnatisectum]